MKKECVIGKITAQGELVLDAPLLIGDGGEDDSDQKDVHVLRNKQGIPYIPGTSLAGVLRAFIAEDMPQATALLFGTEHDNSSSSGELQSSLSLYDVKLSNAEIIVRDGVSISDVTGVALALHKYDYEAVDRGAHGILQLEFTLRGIHAEHKDIIEPALTKLGQRLLGGFYVGAHSMKGFGKVHLKNLTVDCYDFTKPQDVLAWLNPERQPATGHETYTDEQAERTYAAADFVVDAQFALQHSLIVRDYDQDLRNAASPDAETSLSAVMKKDSRGNYIIPGTSLKGVLRHRAGYILRALGKDKSLLETLMGPSVETMKQQPNEAKRRSRFRVDEAILRQGVAAKPQSRNRIDRFTGGTINTALFTTEPIWQKEPGKPVLSLHFGVLKAEAWEAGLTLLLLKDLWLGRTAIGGEKSIGRGTLQGISAEISYQGHQWQLQAGQPVAKEAAEALQHFVTTLVEEVPR